jgi:hypothetical protein
MFLHYDREVMNLDISSEQLIRVGSAAGTKKARILRNIMTSVPRRTEKA